jgi:ComF family protein
LDLLFPPKCPFCCAILDDPRAPLCTKCQPDLPWLVGADAYRQVDFTDGCFSPLAYRKTVPEAVHRYKFSGVRAYSVPFAHLLAQCVQDHLLERPDALTWAPLSAKRLRQRGFDQAERLAHHMGKELSLPVTRTLKKPRHTDPQSHLTEVAERRANALGAYALCPNARISGRKLLLVDDVVTSGSTLSECARLLRQSGAQRVWCVTLAQARKK